MKKFKAATGLQNRHLQTLYPTLLRQCPAIDFTVQQFELEDGDFVDCHWYKKPAMDSKKPIVILFHGLAGSSKSAYIKGMMQHLHSNGYSSVLMHFRGCSERLNRTARAYHSGDTADAKAWIAHLKESYPASPLFAIGYSLGGNMLLKLLAEYSHSSPLSAAVSVSAPIQLASCSATMQHGFAKVYQRYLLRPLKISLLKKFLCHDYMALIGLSVQSIKKINSIEQFDNLYTAKIHGFRDAKEYYKISSAGQYLPNIQCQTLIIQALDDPFMGANIEEEFRELPINISIDTPENGGHLGFVSGSLFKPKYWLEQRISHYFSTTTAQQ
ncbi:MAG: hydrolase [Gammaproteobacteria bacterium]|nr:hydrolase [Gammaproteobacteria bacterium]